MLKFKLSANYHPKYQYDLQKKKKKRKKKRKKKIPIKSLLFIICKLVLSHHPNPLYILYIYIYIYIYIYTHTHTIISYRMSIFLALGIKGTSKVALNTAVKRWGSYWSVFYQTSTNFQLVSKLSTMFVGKQQTYRIFCQCSRRLGFNPWSSHTKDSKKKWHLILPCLTLSIIS